MRRGQGAVSAGGQPDLADAAGADVAGTEGTDGVATSAHGRPVAPGGWRRIVIGLLIGLLAGAAVALAMPRDDGPRRRSLLDDLDDLVDRG